MASDHLIHSCEWYGKHCYLCRNRFGLVASSHHKCGSHLRILEVGDSHWSYHKRERGEMSRHFVGLFRRVPLCQFHHKRAIRLLQYSHQGARKLAKYLNRMEALLSSQTFRIRLRISQQCSFLLRCIVIHHSLL